MAMPRPTGKPFRIATEVVPGLSFEKKGKRKKPLSDKGSMSKVEILQTNLIEEQR